jgi:predicted transcriptional regulator
MPENAKRGLRTNLSLEEFEKQKDQYIHHDTRILDVDFKNIAQITTTFPDIYNLYFPSGSDRLYNEFDILMKIYHDPASRIYAGTKHFELRKYAPKHTGTLFLMETEPGQAVTGCFSFDTYIADTVDKLWHRVGEGATSYERFFEDYKTGSFGVALPILSFHRFAKAIPLKHVYSQFPEMPRLPHPIVYLYTPKGQDLSRFLRTQAGM